MLAEPARGGTSPAERLADHRAAYLDYEGPVSGGTADLQFELTVAGLFEPNAKGNTFAAKISSQQGGNAGGFVSHGSVSQVPLPAAVWLFLSALAGLAVFSRRRKAAA